MPASKELRAVAEQRLLEEQQAVEKELLELGVTPDGSVEVALDEGFADAAQSTSERARVLSLVEGLQERLLDVRAALQRIEKGTYGSCQSCGKEIAPERLDAIPAARLCISCKQKAT